MRRQRHQVRRMENQFPARLSQPKHRRTKVKTALPTKNFLMCMCESEKAVAVSKVSHRLTDIHATTKLP